MQFLSIPPHITSLLVNFYPLSLSLTQHTPHMLIIMATASRPSNDHHPHVTVAFIISLIIFLLLPLTSSGENCNECESLFKKKMVLGSKPPACVNKCSSCRPCVATLVVPSHKYLIKASFNSHGDDDSYYLLSWKCRCGDKLFQP